MDSVERVTVTLWLNTIMLHIFFLCCEDPFKSNQQLPIFVLSIWMITEEVQHQLWTGGWIMWETLAAINNYHDWGWFNMVYTRFWAWIMALGLAHEWQSTFFFKSSQFCMILQLKGVPFWLISAVSDGFGRRKTRKWWLGRTHCQKGSTDHTLW